MANKLNHRPRKRFGQNFLHDPGIINKIVQSIAPKKGDHLVEIGPGKGAITKLLIAVSDRLDAIELDRDLLDHLHDKFANKSHFQLHNADALKFDFCSLTQGNEAIRVVGNLPYNISTPLLFHLLDQSDCIEDMHFMLQKEVVDRMSADPGSKTYGRLSVMLQVRCKVEPLFTIAPGAFNPEPKVQSAFVRLIPFKKAVFAIHSKEDFSKLVTQAFSQRRKTLRNTLKGLLTEEAIRQAGIDPSARPETLSPEDFVSLHHQQVSAG